MDIDISPNSLRVYQALDSEVRLEILEIISSETITATELAQRMNISKAAISKNLHILEKANIISFNPDYSCTKFLTTAKSVKYNKLP